MVFAGELGRQNAASQQKTTSNKTEEIPGWTANSHFSKPACLFQLDRVSRTYSCPFISYSGNLRFRSSSQSRQILKCILGD